MRHLLIAITLMISLSGCYVNLELPISRDQPLEERVLGGSGDTKICLLYTSPSPRDATLSRMPSSA